MSVPADPWRPTGPVATEASAPSVILPPAMPSMPRLRGEDQDDVGGLRARLKAPASAGQRHEDRIAPGRAQGVAHGEHPVAVPAAEHERNLGHIGNHRDAVSARQQRIRHPLVRHGLDFLQHFGGRQQAAFFAGCRRVRNIHEDRGRAQASEQQLCRRVFPAVEHRGLLVNLYIQLCTGTDRPPSHWLRKLNPGRCRENARGLGVAVMRPASIRRAGRSPYWSPRCGGPDRRQEPVAGGGQHGLAFGGLVPLDQDPAQDRFGARRAPIIGARQCGVDVDAPRATPPRPRQDRRGAGEFHPAAVASRRHTNAVRAAPARKSAAPGARLFSADVQIIGFEIEIGQRVEIISGHVVIGPKPLGGDLNGVLGGGDGAQRIAFAVRKGCPDRPRSRRPAGCPLRRRCARFPSASFSSCSASAILSALRQNVAQVLPGPRRSRDGCGSRWREKFRSLRAGIARRAHSRRTKTPRRPERSAWRRSTNADRREGCDR